MTTYWGKNVILIAFREIVPNISHVVGIFRSTVMTMWKCLLELNPLKDCHKADYHIYPKLHPLYTHSCQVAFPSIYFALSTHQKETALPFTKHLIGNSAYQDNGIHLATKQFPNNILFSTNVWFPYMVQVMVHLQNFTYPNIDLYWSILEILFQSMRQKLGKRDMPNRMQGVLCIILMEKTQNLFGKCILM